MKSLMSKAHTGYPAGHRVELIFSLAPPGPGLLPARVSLKGFKGDSAPLPRLIMETREISASDMT